MCGEAPPRHPSGCTTGLQTAWLTDRVGLPVRALAHAHARTHTFRGTGLADAPVGASARAVLESTRPAGLSVSPDSLGELPGREGTVTHFHQGDVKLLLRKRRSCM